MPVAAPTAAGRLAAVELTAGAAAATVDVTGGFAGTVDTYGATSSHPAVVSASTAGAVITLTPRTAGSATITVTATNTAGAATQTITVTVTPAATAPTATGTLAAQTLTAGDTATVDVAGAFTGTIDTYTVTSSNGAVLDVALAGSTITLTGVTAGTATVTVTAANTAGSATQTLAATVNLPPAPTLAAPLAAQTLQVTETRTIDIASGFAGRIDTYTATSGDTNTLTATADGSQIALQGVAEGSTTVTITAINAAGRAARSFAVTVNALTAPQTANTPLARTIAVGEQLDIDIADAFTGIIATYSATSSDTTAATATADGPTVTLTGVAEGTATITLTAANTAGTATATVTVTVQTPGELTIAVAAPSHCLGSEGVLAPGGGRRGVGSMDVTYAIRGGAGPYTITSPDAPGITHNTPSGVFRVSCARRGVDLTAVPPDVNVVEAGPRTLTITATDNTGTTTHADILVEIAEDAYTTNYHGGIMHAGRTYVLGDATEWVLITLPAGLNLEFKGLSENSMAHFEEPTTGAELILDWHTGTEIRRTVPPVDTSAAAGANAATQFAKQSATARSLVGSFFGALAASAKATEDLAYRIDETARWRPYRGLESSSAIVALHPTITAGEKLEVCTESTNTDFIAHISVAVEAWNSRLTGATRASIGRSKDVFAFDSSNPACDSDVYVKLVLKVSREETVGTETKRGIDCGTTFPAAGCAHSSKNSDPTSPFKPPIVNGSLIEISDHILTLYTDASVRRVLIHELGHFLGLGDYGYGCTKLGSDRSVMSYGESKSMRGSCHPDTSGTAEDMISGRDVRDLSAIYSPSRRGRVEIIVHNPQGGHPQGSFSERLVVSPGDPPIDLESAARDSSQKYALLYREVGARGDAHLLGVLAWDQVHDFDHSSPATVLDSYYPGRSNHDFSRFREGTDYEFILVGLTHGDPLRDPRKDLGLRHSVLPDSAGAWTLGEPAVAALGRPSPAHPPRSGSGGTARPGPRPAPDSPTSSEEGDEPAAVKIVYCPKDDPSWVLREMVPVEDSACERIDVGEVVEVEVFECPKAAETVPVAGSAAPACRPTALALSRWVLGCSGEFSEMATYLPAGVVARVCVNSETVAGTPRLGDPECDTVDGYRLVRRFVMPGVPLVRVCEKSETIPATPRQGDPVCDTAAGFRLVSRFVMPGVSRQECEKTDRIAATPRLGDPRCDDARYSLVWAPGRGHYCRRVIERPATATVTYVCPAGYGLVNLGTPLCYLSESKAARATVRYLCPIGYGLVTRTLPLGRVARTCEKTVRVLADVSYSCPSGYTRSATVCRKYTYESPTRGRCPAGYTSVYNGIVHLCRKRVSISATVTYTCDAGYTRSGRWCSRTFTTTVTRKTIYSCEAGFTLSGTRCVRSDSRSPTVKTTYSCADLGFTPSGATCRKVDTRTPTRPTVYECPRGYTPAGRDCTKTTTKSPTRPTVYECPGGVAPAGRTCTITTTKAPTRPTVYDCPGGFTPSGTECTRTITKPLERVKEYYCKQGFDRREPDPRSPGAEPTCISATTTPPTKTTTHRCPTVPAGEPPYEYKATLTGATTIRTCTRTITTGATIDTRWVCDDANHHVRTTDDGTGPRRTCVPNPPSNPG